MGWVNAIEKDLRKIKVLEQLTGLTIDELIDKFAAGYTLKAPDKPLTIYEMERNYM